METVKDYFGSLVFDDRVMKATLSDQVYASLKKTIDQGTELDISVAHGVAMAMKEWALSKGATHFTHWFQPLTGITAEKHDSFITPSPDGGVIMDFSGKELIKGEPDASSFPSGGLRATFEARGYTAWDPTSYAFIKGRTLCIPTAFCSYGGHALDKKTPLLRSMEALNKQALRILRLFGNDSVKRVTSSVGPEQEYFLITKEMYERRPDLRFTGRTLFGAKPPKGQEMDDHYFGVIKPRVAAYMEELNDELWKLGILAKTEHNEVAPAQHEIDFKYDEALTTADNIMTFKLAVKTIAKRHGLHATFMPKPRFGVNGSGMHINMSLSREGKNVFANPEDVLGLSRTAYYFIGGIMKHMKGMAAITNPLVNSYKRLVPGYEAPVYLAWSATNRSPLIRIPAARGEGTRIELRCPDPSANPYLALAVCLRAGLDGIVNQILPPQSVDCNIFSMSEEERKATGIEAIPGTLIEAVYELEKDEFIQEALGRHVSRKYIRAKKQEWADYRAQVTEWEIGQYLNRF